ncbi:MAG: hypothetical protein ACE5HN_04760 [Nitrospiria bacterium]
MKLWKGLWVILFLGIIGIVAAGGETVLALTQTEEETGEGGIQEGLDGVSLVIGKGLILERGDSLHPAKKGALSTNPCFLQIAEWERRCRPSNKRERAERLLEGRFLPFEREDHYGDLFLSVSENALEFGIRNLVGAEAWVLRWDFPSGR